MVFSSSGIGFARPALLAVAVVISGCCSIAHRADTSPAVVFTPISSANVRDGRAFFRQVFCQLPARADLDCNALLRRYPDEPAPASIPVPAYRRKLTEIVIVTGLFGQCLPDVPAFADALPRLGELGYSVTHAPVHGRASAVVNAAIVRDHVLRRLQISGSRQVILLTYSKGTADSMTALAAYPELAHSVAALVSFAGAVNGSPLADWLESFYSATLSHIPFPNCPVNDKAEISDLTRAYRLAWLATHSLPAQPLYFSIVAAPEPGRVSTLLRGMHAALSKIDSRNDGQVIHSDAIVPRSMLLAYANTDHLGVALPFSTHAPFLAATVIDHNDFPRAALVEAAVRTVEISLSTAVPFQVNYIGEDDEIPENLAAVAARRRQ